jgi:hypothetical protein
VIKKFVHFLLTIGTLAGLGCVLWIGMQKHEEKIEEAKAEEATKAAEEAEPKPEDFTVVLEKERAKALGIDKEQPEKTELQARRIAFGSVLDPTPLVALDGELASAEAALKASKAENERTQSLVATNDASRKTADAAEAQFVADRIKLETLVRGAQLAWGALVDRDSTKRRAFVDELVSGRIALIRVDLMPGDALAELPKSASIIVMGREDKGFSTTEVLPATATDAKTQAQGFILRARPPFTLRPGMALTAWMELPDKPRAGFAIPRSAVLRHDGRTWVYVQEEAEKYVRKPVTLDAPLDGERGWFVLEGGGVTEDDVIVVVGASSLLSEELKAQGGAPE